MATAYMQGMAGACIYFILFLNCNISGPKKDVQTDIHLFPDDTKNKRIKEFSYTDEIAPQPNQITKAAANGARTTIQAVSSDFLFQRGMQSSSRMSGDWLMSITWMLCAIHLQRFWSSRFTLQRTVWAMKLRSLKKRRGTYCNLKMY